MSKMMQMMRAGRSVNRAALRAVNAERRRKGQAGFTLLELLVVVAILAGIAGTATIVLQDTDRRANAAAHVAMMDELKKGVATFQVLRAGKLPDSYDSLLQSSAGNSATASLLSVLAEPLNNPTAAAESFLKMAPLPAGVTKQLNDAGIKNLRLVNTASAPANPGTVTTCADLKRLVNDRTGATVVSNLFEGPTAYGCGVNYEIADGNNVAIWVGGQRRVLGSTAVELGAYATAQTPTVAATTDTEGQRLLMAVGFGPSTTLFDGRLGALTTVPTYRHTAKDEYNRFIGLFEVANAIQGASTPGTTGGAATPGTVTWDAVTPNLVAIVDGAGDTKDEELGEWDGTRSTI